MFIFASIIFIIFTALYGLFAAAILYHLKQYTLPDHPAPRIVTSAFLFLSVLFWLFSVTFLLKIPY